MEYQHILFNAQDRIATLTFNRPQALNALNQELLDELSDALDTTSAGEEIRVLILTGSGAKAFVAGADITELTRLNPLQAKLFAAKGHRIMDKIASLPIPVIAAVNGYALGGGNEIALACDFIYAAENATFGLPEINLGLMPGFGGTQRLPRLVGVNMARELIFSGKMISAAEAFRIGLVNRVCPPETLMDEVMKVAGAMASKGRVSLRAAKQAINNGLNVDLASGCRMEIDAFALCLDSQDAREGTTAFLEKRKAVFSGDLTK